MAIVADGPMQIYRATGETWYMDGTDRPKIYVRLMPGGMALVASYVEDGQAVVRMVVDGMSYHNWYNTSPITTRQAALLVNRFLRDLREAKP
jgi:hypothetical protein